MSDEISINKNEFHNRLSTLVSQWKSDKRSGNNVFGDVGSMAIVMGKSDDSLGFHKANALQFWLLGYEFPATLFVITPEAIYILTTKKKAAYLEPLKDGKMHVELLIRGKDVAENAKLFERCIDVIKNAGKKVGVTSKEHLSGPFVTEWDNAFGDASKELEEVDVSLAISQAMSVKDENELRSINYGSRATATILQDYFVDAMSDILDKDKKITNKALSDMVARKIDDEKIFKQTRLKMPPTFDPLQLDWSLTPTVMSGGNFDTSLTAQPDENSLHPGVIIMALGLRYATYSSIIVRTYLVDPSKTQENIYKLLLNVHETVIKEMRDGVAAKDVYNKAISLVKAKKPELEKNFLKAVGTGIGIETQDPCLVIGPKCNRVLRDGMTFSVTTGFADLQRPDAKDKKRDGKYSLMVADTVRVSSSGTETFVYTKHAASDTETTMFFFNDEAEEDAKKAKPKAKKDPRVGAIVSSNITKTRLRGQGGATQNEEKEAARKAHQKELHNKKQKDGSEKYGEGHGNLSGVQEKKFKRFESYKRDTPFPTRVKDLMILVDAKNSSILLPIMGRPVPFHINTLKNATTSAENDFCYLRINLLSPGQGVGRKDDQPFEDPNAHFVRSLTFRSKDAERMEDIKDQITEMKKAAVRKEQEKKEMEDVVEQDKLVEIRNRRPHRLDNIYMRPAMENKRIGGSVEIHQNGLRYQHLSNQRIDVLFSNVKHLFFQPCVGELIVIIHVHLINPIIIGKKKTRDVQFYREATEMQFDETGNRKRKHRYGDDEEFEAEQEEKRRRAQLDKEFRNFAEKIADAGKSEGLSVDMPFRDLGFNGVPARSSVNIQPTTDCLVQLIEPPFLALTLNDIEIVHLERVQFGLKNFDMVIVFKDFMRPPAHINTIPVESLDSVKDWLDSVDIAYSEGPLNLNWAMIMKTVIADPHEFFKDGGWGFLDSESSDEADDEEEEESAFEASGDDFASDESSEDESDFDEDASAEASEEEMSDDEDGDDWDELEKKAKKKDKQSGLQDESDAEDRKAKGKKKR